MKIVSPLPIVYTVVIAILLTGVTRAADPGSPAIRLSATKVIMGSLVLVEFDAAKVPHPVSDVRISFLEFDIHASAHPVKSRTYFALAGVPMTATPGSTLLSVQWTSDDCPQRREIPIWIHTGKYRMEKLTVDPGTVELSAADVVRVRREKEEIRQLYATGSADMLWNGVFQFPIVSDITSAFGNQRMFNGQLRSYHNGVDFRASEGNPVYAANSGRIRLAKNLFFSGNIVIIDHGSGIFTNYAHLNRIDVESGQHVAKAQSIGTSGATGRVSGPHLHWGVRVNGAYVDPLQFTAVIAGMVQQ